MKILLLLLLLDVCHTRNYDTGTTTTTTTSTTSTTTTTSTTSTTTSTTTTTTTYKQDNTRTTDRQNMDTSNTIQIIRSLMPVLLCTLGLVAIGCCCCFGLICTTRAMKQKNIRDNHRREMAAIAATRHQFALNWNPPLPAAPPSGDSELDAIQLHQQEQQEQQQ